VSDNIFGLGPAKFTGTGDPDSGTVILYASVFMPAFTDPQFAEGVSPLTGYRNFEELGDYSEFEVIINAYKYDGTSAFGTYTTSTILTKLRSYAYKDVVFYPHKDGSTAGDGNGKPMKDASSNNVNYYVTMVKPYYIEGMPFSKNKLRIMMRFKSRTYTDITKVMQ